MKVRTSWINIALAGALAFSASAAIAQGPPGAPGATAMGSSSGTPYGGSSGSGTPYGGSSSSGMPGGANGAASQTITTSSTSTEPTEGALPKTGGDPLTLAAAGSLLLSGGYAIRRRFRGR